LAAAVGDEVTVLVMTGLAPADFSTVKVSVDPVAL
jgi:hypothetical protein